MGKKLRIAFIDHNLDNFHANTFLKLIRSDFADRAEVVACRGEDPVLSKAWASTNGVALVEDLRQFTDQIDAFAILAPSNPEIHLRLCSEILPFGKPTFVDKTFAPDLKTARSIFALADQHKVAMQSSSVLRYTAVQAQAREMDGVEHVVTWGSGSSFGEYAIHPLELAVSVLGFEARAVMRRGQGSHSQLLLNFSGERTAVVNVYCDTDTPFAAALSSKKQTRVVTVDSGRLFADGAAALVQFLEQSAPSIDRRETLAIRAILDAANEPAALQGFVSLPDFSSEGSTQSPASLIAKH